MSMIVNDVEIPKSCAECVAGTYEYNDNDERCFVCGFIKSKHPWECEHAEIDGIDTTKMRAHFCPIAEVATPHWISVKEQLPKEDGSYLVSGKWESGKESVGDCEFLVEDGYFQTAWNFDVLAWMPLPEAYKG